MDVTVLGEIGRRLQLDIIEFESDLWLLQRGLIPDDLREPQDAFVSLLAPLKCAETASQDLVRDCVRQGYRIGSRAPLQVVGAGTAGGDTSRTDDAGNGHAVLDDIADDPVAILLHLDERLQRLLIGLELALTMIESQGERELCAALKELQEAAHVVRNRLDAFEQI